MAFEALEAIRAVAMASRRLRCDEWRPRGEVDALVLETVEAIPPAPSGKRQLMVPLPRV